MGNLNFNVDETPPMNMDFEPLPEGRYLVQITKSEVVPTSSGSGLLLKFQASVLEPGYEGRIIFGQLNIKNDSEKAQQIGRGQLSALCRACGKIGIVEDSPELHGIPFIVKVVIEQSAGYEPKNVIKSFFSPESKGKTAVREQANKERKAQGMEERGPNTPGHIVQDEDLPDFLKD